MGIIKLFVIVALLYLVYRGLNVVLARVRANLEPRQSETDSANAALEPCSICHVHMPANELFERREGKVCGACKNKP